MDYIAIDFETANSNLFSACSIGIVGVKNDKIIIEEHHLINPEEEFNQFNVLIHGITKRMVSNEATFPHVWEKIKHYFDNTILVAHNADFDLGVLKAMLEKYHLELPNIRYTCTLKISRIIWKSELTNFKLSTVSKFLELEHHHHNALSDALICYEIIKRTNKILSTASIDEINTKLYLRYGALNQSRFYSPSRINKHYHDKYIIQNEVLNGKNIYLAGKPKFRTKKKMTDDLLRNGVYLEKAVSNGLDYYVVLEKYSQSSYDKVKYIISKGVKITLISEEEIYKLVVLN